MIQQEIEDQEVLEEWLSERRGHRVHIRVPKKGEGEAGGTCEEECTACFEYG